MNVCHVPSFSQCVPPNFRGVTSEPEKPRMVMVLSDYFYLSESSATSTQVFCVVSGLVELCFW